MSELSVGSLSGLAANSYVVDIASGSSLDLSNATDLPASALPAGSILQVVSATKTDQFATTATGVVDVPGLSVSITPSSASSKVLVFFNLMLGNSVTATDVHIKLLRDATWIAKNTDAGTQTTTFMLTGVNYVPYHPSLTHLDSPATTSSVTYKIQMERFSGTGTVNRRGDNAGNGAVSSITVMEVAG